MHWKALAPHCLILLTLALQPLAAQQGTQGGEWRVYGGDTGSTKYSPLDQINAENVSELEIVWRWKANNFGPRPDYNWETTPLMANGVLYTTAGTRRDAVAIDPLTGETLWMFRFDDKATGDVIHEMELPSGTTGLPMTYLVNGRQFIVVAIGGRGHLAELVARAVP